MVNFVNYKDYLDSVENFYAYYDGDDMKSKMVSYISNKFQNKENPFAFAYEECGCGDYDSRMHDLLLSIFTSYDLLFKEYDIAELTFDRDDFTTLKQVFKKYGYNYDDSMGGCNVENMQSLCDIAFANAFKDIVRDFYVAYNNDKNKRKEKSKEK